MSELNQDSSSVQGDEDLQRPIPLDEEPRINSEVQVEDSLIIKTIGCEDGTHIETQSSLEPVEKPVLKNKALVSKAIGCEDEFRKETQSLLEPIEDSELKNKALFPKGKKLRKIINLIQIWEINSHSMLLHIGCKLAKGERPHISRGLFKYQSLDEY
jgi:hypothetical protein